MTSSTNHIKPSVKEIREKKNTILSIKRSQTTEEEYFRIYNRICDHVSQQKDGGYKATLIFKVTSITAIDSARTPQIPT
jgi:hypothetical protein